MPGALLVRAVFGALVLATVGAFFITQRLKGSTPVVTRVRLQAHLSPNGDGRKEAAALRFDLPEPREATVSIVAASGVEVRRLAEGRRLAGGRHFFSWDGRTDAGGVAAEGLYRVRVALPSEARAVLSAGAARLDVTPPRPRITAVREAAGRGAEIRFVGRSSSRPVVRVYRSDGPGGGSAEARHRAAPAKQVDRFRIPKGAQTARWSGMVDGRPASDGNYAFAVTVRDTAGNVGSAPGRLPPTADEAPPGTGLSISRLAVSGPLEPVEAGATAALQLRPPSVPYRWSLERAGTTRPLARGGVRGPRASIRVPERTPTGLYVLRVSGGDGRALVPLAVRATRRPRGRRAARRPRVLVVLPALTWQGSNPVDDDRDGFGDTLDTAAAVPVDRPFAAGALPVGFRDEVEPLLAFLDREGLRYDLTTDLALARGTGPGLRSAAGVAFAGTERWLPQLMLDRIRDFVGSGGRVATFGTDDFRRRVALSGDRLEEPAPLGAANTFGERTRVLRIAPAPLVVTGDRIGLFRATTGFVGLFSQFDETVRKPRGARIAAAGERERPALVAYRLGRGLLVRIGARGWSAALAGSGADTQVATVTRTLWTLLSR